LPFFLYKFYLIPRNNDVTLKYFCRVKIYKVNYI
jgi:hypothetical protein